MARERSAADADRAFTVGLFSLLDVLTGTPMVELLTQLPLDRRTTQALIEHEGPEGHLLRAVTAYERAPVKLLANVLGKETVTAESHLLTAATSESFQSA